MSPGHFVFFSFVWGLRLLVKVDFRACWGMLGPLRGVPQHKSLSVEFSSWKCTPNPQVLDVGHVGIDILLYFHSSHEIKTVFLKIYFE